MLDRECPPRAYEMSQRIPWSVERVNLLKQLWLNGLSASQIARELGGVSRNAVIGKAHRLGLSGGKYIRRPKCPLDAKPRRAHVKATPLALPPRETAINRPAKNEAERRAKEAEVAVRRKEIAAAADRIETPPAGIGPKPCRIFDLRWGTANGDVPNCRYPIGGQKEKTVYCGAAALERDPNDPSGRYHSYCCYHAIMCTRGKQAANIYLASLRARNAA